MILSVFLPGISRTVKPFKLLQSVHGKHLLTASPILRNTFRQKVPANVTQESYYHHRNIATKKGIAFPTQVRYLSISPQMAADQDIQKAVKNEVREVKINEAQAKAMAQKSIEEKKGDADYSKIYGFKHIINLSLIAVIPAALIGNSPATDYLFVVIVFLHNHFSFENIINDYISVYNFGENVPKFTQLLSMVVSLFILVGLVNVIQNDIGIAQTFHCLWKVGKKDIADELERIRKELELEEEAAKKIKK